MRVCVVVANGHRPGCDCESLPGHFYLLVNYFMRKALAIAAAISATSADNNSEFNSRSSLRIIAYVSAVGMVLPSTLVQS